MPPLFASFITYPIFRLHIHFSIVAAIVIFVVASATIGRTGLAMSTADNSHVLPTDAIPELIHIEAGDFIKGSDAREREYAYRIDEAAYKHKRTRIGRWYDREPRKQNASTAKYSIGKTAVTNHQYRYFIDDTGHPQPSVDEQTWNSYRLVHPFDRTRDFVWRNNHPPADKEQHPVVLVSYDDAQAYAAWLSLRTGQTWRLPEHDQWERAARGDVGAIFPWGNEYDASRLNSHDAGPFSTQAVGKYPNGSSHHGMLDAAGQVFEWIATEPKHKRAWVKGGSWDDKGCGVCRPAARHTRPKFLKHILVGFRVVRIAD